MLDTRAAAIYERDTAMWTRWRHGGDQTALASLMALYEPLVRRAARAAVRRHPAADLDDVLQSGRLGMLAAIQTWDPVHGVALAGYCRRPVELACAHGVRQQQPTADASLDDTVPGDHDGPALTLADVLADPNATADRTDRLDDHAGRLALREALARLGERTREIVVARLGDPATPLGVLAARHGISVARVSQIESAGRKEVVAAAREMLSAVRR